jgi:hypothetical protein
VEPVQSPERVGSHPRQTWLVESQIGVAPAQSMLPTHPTQ